MKCQTQDNTPCEVCVDKACKGKQDGCLKGVKEFLIKETGKDCSLIRCADDRRNPYFALLDGKYNAANDVFDEYVTVLMAEFPDLTVYQAVGYVFVWLCTREQAFIFTEQDEGKGDETT